MSNRKYRPGYPLPLTFIEKGIHCPKCGEDEHFIRPKIYKRIEGGIKRVRQCLLCGQRFSTTERVDAAGDEGEGDGRAA